ncbi:MAG: GNAT family N-acetyltransferase, partial [Anaerolineae bacterium]|nr:GNAT family N-acetyltransferase [Anaerolineae bacterium]
MVILPAQEKDAALLREICLKSKAYWNYPREWMDQLSHSAIITSESINRDIVCKIMHENETLGWYRLITESSNGALLEDLWVLPDAIGRGIGRMLFEHMLEQAHSGGFTAVELDADPHA